MNGFLRGTKGFLGALPFMLSHRLAWLFLVPLVLWALFAAAMFQAGSWLTDLLQGLAAQYMDLSVPAVEATGWQGVWNQMKAALNTTRDALLWLVVKVAAFWLVGLMGKYLVLILLSPVMAYASERTEALLTGVSVPFQLVRFMKETLRGMVMALRNGLLEGLITIALWAGTLLLPLAAPVTALLLWLVSSWFYGFSMFDYIYERRGLGIGGSLHAAQRDRPTILANGVLFNLLMKVPVIGLLTAPLLGAVGAVLARAPHAATAAARKP